VPARDCDEALPGSLFAGDLPQGSTGVEATLWGEAASAPIQLPAGRGLIVAGPGLFGADFASALRDAAHRLFLPVLADPLSGLRFGPAADAVLTGYDALLRNESAADALRPDWVLRFGGAPVSKVLGQWLAGIPAILVDPTGGWTDPSHDLIRRLVAEPAAACRVLTAPRTPETAWLGRWRGAENRVKAIAEAQLAEPDWCEAKLIRALLKAIPSGESLLCANSLPIRQLDTWSDVRKAPLAIHGNRGASGIDGQLSTLAGLNEGDSPCWALLGDLSAVHDLSGWLLKDRLRRPVVVINNGGGRIFDYLPQRGLPGFETLWRTPVAPGFAALADAFGFSHREIRSADDLDEALRSAMKPHANSGSNAMLWEVVIDADRSRRVQLDYWRQVADAEGLVEP
jgi:2-succinyl-5-enolpyruvyl-6-hydroxy-3-cyclohexene-1-carboxylate synthase